MNRLARTRLPAWLARVAMTALVFFGAAHAAAMAAVAAGPLVLTRADTLSFDLLQICSANGLIQINRTAPDGRQPPVNPQQQDTAKDQCPVCGSASTSPFTGVATVHVPVLPFLPEAFSLAPDKWLTATRTNRQNLIRAPPQFTSL
jgi:hypothetical protein